MTILLAALLGNVCAWCVHVFTWWLRERHFKIAAFIGVLLGIGYTMALILIINNDSKIAGRRTDFSIASIITSWAAFLMFGWLQSYYSSLYSYKRMLMMSAAFAAEFVAALLAYGAVFLAPIYIKFPLLFEITGEGVFSTLFWITLLFLAIFRPLVVRYASLFRELMRSKSVEQ